jgi:transposase-like protein
MAAVKFTSQLTVQQFDALFPDEDACRAYLTKRRWPRGVRCPRCGGDRVYELKTMPWKWECPDCAPKGYRFSVLVGTIFENTNIPLRTWFRVIHLMLVSKKGISAFQVHRMVGFGSYRTAWYMCHRIRAGLQDPNFRKLVGIVEIDETFIGGKNKNRHKNKRTPATGGSGKTPIAGAVSRKGNVVARVIENTDAATLTGFVREAVSTKVNLLASDENAAYRGLGEDYLHRTVRHTRGEYVVGAVHTQTIDSFWSLIKRGVMGTFHKVSKKYLLLYVAEFEFRYNHRNNPDIFDVAVARC